MRLTIYQSPSKACVIVRKAQGRIFRVGVYVNLGLKVNLGYNFLCRRARIRAKILLHAEFYLNMTRDQGERCKRKILLQRYKLREKFAPSPGSEQTGPDLHRKAITTPVRSEPKAKLASGLQMKVSARILNECVKMCSLS